MNLERRTLLKSAAPAAASSIVTGGPQLPIVEADDRLPGGDKPAANARLCMASAVTGFIATYGVDEPAGCYQDEEWHLWQ